MSTFKSLHILNYRIWFIGALISNIGTWMQRTAQDWLVFAHLTAHDAGAVGITMALQLGPQLFLAPVAGLLADRFNRKRLLVLTQSAMALLSAGLGILVVSGAAQLWQVYAFALMLGVVSALDAPVRQTFVSELVQDDYLSNAVALNSASFNVARMIGPAVAGVLTAVVGPGWVFLINTLTFVAMLLSLAKIPAASLRRLPRARAGKGRIREGLRYVRFRPDLVVVLVAVFIVGTLGLNFALFIAAMVGTEFGLDAGGMSLVGDRVTAISGSGQGRNAPRRCRRRSGSQVEASMIRRSAGIRQSRAPTSASLVKSWAATRSGSASGPTLKPRSASIPSNSATEDPCGIDVPLNAPRQDRRRSPSGSA